MITKELVLAMLDEPGTHRKQFSSNSGIQKEKNNPTFSVPFDNGILRHFREGTGLSMSWGEQHKQFYCFLRHRKALEAAERWVEAQGTRVFIRNLMSSSLALDFNFVDNVSGTRTHLGGLEERGKRQGDADAVAEMVLRSSETVQSFSYLVSCDCLMAVPAMPDKKFDLPRELANGLAQGTGKHDLTSTLVLSGKTKSAKAVGLAEKWDIWEKCTFTYHGPKLEGRRVLLVDDKYQSGITMQFWAAKLLEMGAVEVHGLSMVKTLRDTDNV